MGSIGLLAYSYLKSKVYHPYPGAMSCLSVGAKVSLPQAVNNLFVDRIIDLA
jgi:hypothetical protein